MIRVQFADINLKEKADATHSFLVGEPALVMMNANTGTPRYQKADSAALRTNDHDQRRVRYPGKIPVRGTFSTLSLCVLVSNTLSARR